MTSLLIEILGKSKRQQKLYQHHIGIYNTNRSCQVHDFNFNPKNNFLKHCETSS